MLSGDIVQFQNISYYSQTACAQIFSSFPPLCLTHTLKRRDMRSDVREGRGEGSQQQAKLNQQSHPFVFQQTQPGTDGNLQAVSSIQLLSLPSLLHSSSPA